LAMAMAGWAGAQGHSCRDLGLGERAVSRSMGGERSQPVDASAQAADDLPAWRALEWPDAATWAAELRAATSAVRVVESLDPEPDLDPRPLVLHGTRLFLQRHWIDEGIITTSLRGRATAIDGELTAPVATMRDALLPVLDPDGNENLQRRAVETVLANRLAIVVGGPGTGKTYTVARLLAVLLADERARGRSLRIGLAAPTGKAAARMQESLRDAVSGDDFVAAVPAEVRAELAALTPVTVHRLLGPLPDRRQRFRHDADQRLPYDIVVIDETSMVPLPLMARLMEAMPTEARLVLVGDPDQLESVELGAVLGDLTSVAESGAPSPLSGRLVRLLRAVRYGGESPIALLATAIRVPDASAANVLAAMPASASDGPAGSVRFVEVDSPIAPSALEAVRAVVAPVLERLADHARAGRSDEALRALLECRILCAHREGHFGVSQWNRYGEAWMCGSSGDNGTWYPGRPLLATRNDPRTGLANGDTGVVVVHDGRKMAAFATATGVRLLETVQLDDVETAFAMTVHKSQGSEYQTVVMILPPAHSPLVGRELLYTGVTRARRHLLAVGQSAAVVASALTPAERMTGLRDALRD
ncbi:MAG: exodeoxyribonuclease V subunit alpha, partial [Ilumatobacteraceae bacterium]